MSEIRLRATGEIISEDTYRALHPQVSFAIDFKPADGDRLLPVDAPDVGPNQRAVRNGAKKVGKNYVQAWKVEALSAQEIEAIEAGKAAAARQKAKRERDEKVAKMIVVIGNKKFNGDEISQGRMMRKIFDMESRNVATTPWTLADNTRVDVTVAELRDALASAERYQSALWPI